MAFFLPFRSKNYMRILYILSFCLVVQKTVYSQNEPKVKSVNQVVYNALVSNKFEMGKTQFGELNAEDICIAIYKDRTMDSSENRLLNMFIGYDKKFIVEPSVQNPSYPQLVFENAIHPAAKKVFSWFKTRATLTTPEDTLANLLFFDKGYVASPVFVKYVNGDAVAYKQVQAAFYEYLKYYAKFSSPSDEYALLRDKIGGLYFLFSMESRDNFKKTMVCLHSVAEQLNKDAGNKFPSNLYKWILN